MIRDVLWHTILIKIKTLRLIPPTTKKWVKYLLGFLGFWRQQIPQLRILLWHMWQYESSLHWIQGRKGLMDSLSLEHKELCHLDNSSSCGHASRPYDVGRTSGRKTRYTICDKNAWKNHNESPCSSEWSKATPCAGKNYVLIKTTLLLKAILYYISKGNTNILY